MKQIWKYPVEPSGFVNIPKDADILTVQTQNGEPYIWALVDTKSKAVMQKRLIVKGTGHPADDVEADKYIGTFQVQEGTLVFHVFEVKEES